MDLQLEDGDHAFAEKYHSIYAKKPGAEHIASKFALAYLGAILRVTKPASVIEFGAGIGTMTHAILAHPDKVEKLVTTETNQFCLDQLALNIPNDHKNRMFLIDDLEQLKKIEGKFDLMVFDGASATASQIAFLKEGAICFIEGERKKTVKTVKKLLRAHGLTCEFKNYDQGYRYFTLYKKDKAKIGEKRWKFKFRRYIKGFNVGHVTALT